MSVKFAAVFFIFAAGAFAIKNGEALPLWTSGRSGFGGDSSKPEVVAPGKPGDSTHLSSIHHPSMLVYLPAKDRATGAAMIVAPGVGHRFLSIDTEGTNVAEWLNSVGVAAFVLKYRLAREEGVTIQGRGASLRGRATGDSNGPRACGRMERQYGEDRNHGVLGGRGGRGAGVHSL